MGFVLDTRDAQLSTANRELQRIRNGQRVLDSPLYQALRADINAGMTAREELSGRLDRQEYADFDRELRSSPIAPRSPGASPPDIAQSLDTRLEAYNREAPSAGERAVAAIQGIADRGVQLWNTIRR